MPNHRPARRIVTGALAVAGLATLIAATGASSAAKPSKIDRKAADMKELRIPQVKADRDKDKLFDDLEARLRPLAQSAERSVIVTLEAPATPARTAGLEQDVGDFDVTRRFTVIKGFAATLTKAQIAELAENPAVVRIEENSRVRALNGTAQSSFGIEKARADAPSLDGDADGSLDAYSSSDLVAAVIDTGVDAGHLDLDEGKVIAFKDFVNGQTTPYDDNGHGTHVAATIAGDGDARADRAHEGVAPNAAIVGLKVLDASGGGTMASVTAAIDWVVQNKDVYGIEAINLSLGAAGCSDGTDATSQAVNRAHSAGIVVVAAAGNEGPGTCTIGAPGAAVTAVTVGAMADSGKGGFKQASFSSRGPTADGRVKPDVSAPGVGIVSAQAGSTSGYTALSGTSMATPFTTGVVLLMQDANPALTPQQVKDKVVATAIDWGRGGDNKVVGSTGADIDYGAGRLDGYAALAAAGAPLGAAPAAPARGLFEGSLSASGAYVDHRFDIGSTAFPVAATLVIPSLSAGAAWSPDFDLYLYDPTGNLVAWSERSERQEDVTHAPARTGTYTLRVRSYRGSGAYFVDVSGALAKTVTGTAFPNATALYAGSVRGGDPSRLRSDDNLYFQVNSTTSGTRTADWYGRVPGVSNAATSLKLAYRGKSSTTSTQVVYIYNWTTGIWVKLDQRSVGTSEVGLALNPTGTLADYVSGTSGDGEVAIRVRSTRGDGVNFYVSGELMSATFTTPG